jgi:AcrR family transcriptional regulator
VSQEGHENLTIRKLARAIEYSPRTIYLYFEDKEHLLHEIVEEGFRRTLEIRKREEPENGLPPEERVQHRIRSHIRAALSDKNFYRAVVTLLFEKNFTPGPAQREVIAQTREDIVRLLADEQSSGEEISALAMIVFSSVRGFALNLVNMEEKLTDGQVEELTERYVAFTTAGIRGLRS